LERFGDDPIRVNAFTILIRHLIKNSSQKNERNTAAVLIGLNILAQLKSTPFAEGGPGDDQIRSEKQDLLEGIFSVFGENKAVVRFRKSVFEFLPDGFV
jgi:hypothetical protein